MVFGVSGRCVHRWELEEPRSASQRHRLSTFAAVVRQVRALLDEPTPEAVRAELQRPGADGLSIIDRLRRERSGGPTWGAPYGPEYFIDAIRG